MDLKQPEIAVEDLGRFAPYVVFTLFAVSVYLGVGALLHAAFFGWAIDWTSLLSVLVLVAWPAFPSGFAAGVSVVVCLFGLVGKRRGPDGGDLSRK